MDHIDRLQQLRPRYNISGSTATMQERLGSAHVSGVVANGFDANGPFYAYFVIGVFTFHSKTSPIMWGYRSDSRGTSPTLQG